MNRSGRVDCLQRQGLSSKGRVACSLACADQLVQLHHSFHKHKLRQSTAMITDGVKLCKIVDGEENPHTSTRSPPER